MEEGGWRVQGCEGKRERLRMADGPRGRWRGKGRNVEEVDNKDGRWRSKRRDGKERWRG